MMSVLIAFVVIDPVTSALPLCGPIPFSDTRKCSYEALLFHVLLLLCCTPLDINMEVCKDDSSEIQDTLNLECLQLVYTVSSHFGR